MNCCYLLRHWISGRTEAGAAGSNANRHRGIDCVSSFGFRILHIPIIPKTLSWSQTELLLQLLLYANLTTWELSNNTRVEFWPFQGVIPTLFGNRALSCSLFSAKFDHSRTSEAY
jgi:hypothetical protein